MRKTNKLTLTQETLKQLTENVQHNNRTLNISPLVLCHTTVPSCPECNPPTAKLN